MGKNSELFNNAEYYSDDPDGFNQDPQRKKLPAIFAALLLLVGGSYFVQTTLAANISINSGPVEFGQGITQATACDDQISVTPISTFVNSSGAGSHKLSSIRISGIDSSPGKCADKIFVIKAYSDSRQLDLFNWENTAYDSVTNPNSEWRETSRYNSVKIKKTANEFTWISGGTDHDDVTSETSTVSNTAFTLNLVSAAPLIRRNPLALADDVKKITIETFDETSDIYDVGDQGIGGGVVVYDAGSRNSWGRYIEVAPGDWNGVTGDATGNSWCSNIFLDVNSTTTQIGFAKENTDRMISPNCTSGIGIKARSYLGGGKSDWSVPTLAEMQLISTLASIVPGIINEGPSGNVGYWVSNGGTGDGSWVASVQVVGGGTGGVNKAGTSPYLRPIRYF